MPLREIIQKRDNLSDANSHYEAGVPAVSVNPIPEIRFVRSDTNTLEVINPPSGHDEGSHGQQHNDFLGPAPAPEPSSFRRKSLSFFRRSSRSPTESPAASPAASPPRSKERRLSSLLHLDRGRSRDSRAISVNLPSDLPHIIPDTSDEQEREAQWEKRATMLVQHNSQLGYGSSPPNSSFGNALSPTSVRSRSRSSTSSQITHPKEDNNIQEAIRLHEDGRESSITTGELLTYSMDTELEESTTMFGRLADPNGANNALSQVLYGLALRHGWGCAKDPERAITFLSAAASNSASIEAEALQAGIKKGGSAKGELVLAIFELANCFRNGWGVAKDPAAARQYFETAANLGDTDAMNEAAWCYLEGFGGKKDKFMAAKYYRLAESKGNKLVGNSWIWKDKYNPK